MKRKVHGHYLFHNYGRRGSRIAIVVGERKLDNVTRNRAFEISLHLVLITLNLFKCRYSAFFDLILIWQLRIGLELRDWRTENRYIHSSYE